MRVATIDIGTNTVLLLIAEQDRAGRLAPVLERATITRLGEGVDRTKVLSASAIARTLACLDEYAEIVDANGVSAIAVVGTSAMRDSEGGSPILDRIRVAFGGVEARVLSGEDEARLTFVGGTSGLGDAELDESAVFDIGGGSTEVVLGTRTQEGARLRYAHSFDLGSVRLTERSVATDPPTEEELEAITRSATRAFDAVPPLARGGRPPIGIAGTMTTLAAVALGMAPYDGAALHGRPVGRVALESVVRRLAKLTVEERRRVPGMEPKRADVIVAGGLIALALLEHWDADRVVISDRGVRWGLAEELVPKLSAGSTH